MNCKSGTKHLFRQINQLLEKLDEPSFSKPLNVYNGSTIGQHFRHIFDFYQCLTSDLSGGLIDYANRERDSSIERYPVYAIRAFSKIEAAIEIIDEFMEINVLADFSVEANAARPVVKSSLGRELMFAYDHAVHHIAIIKMGIQTAFPEILMEENLGIAPSTLKYRAGEKATDK
ncbi:MAG: hypothetical protein R2828_33470 [Saprospiraceae bacterium]